MREDEDDEDEWVQDLWFWWSCRKRKGKPDMKIFLSIFASILLCCLLGCSNSKHVKMGPTEAAASASSSTQNIRDLATSTMNDIPETKSTMVPIISESKKIDVSINTMTKERDKVAKELVKEREENTKLFSRLLAWIMVASSIGLAVSIAAAIYFRTKAALFAAIASGCLLLVAAVMTVVMKMIVWIALIGAVGVVGLIVWMVRHDWKWTKENTI